MVAAAFLKNIKIIPAGKKFNCPTMKQRYLITNYSHVREGKVQIHNIFKDIITFPIHNIGFIEGGRTDFCQTDQRRRD